MYIYQGEQYPVQFYIYDGENEITPADISELVLTIGKEEDIVKTFSKNEIGYDSDEGFYFFYLTQTDTKKLIPKFYPVQLKLKDIDNNIFIMSATDIEVLRSLNNKGEI